MEEKKRNGELTTAELGNVAGGAPGAAGQVCMHCKACGKQFWGASRESARNALFLHLDATGHERIKKVRL